MSTPRRFNVEFEPQKWWQRILGLPKKCHFVLVNPGTPGYETAAYQEIFIYGKDSPWVVDPKMFGDKAGEGYAMGEVR